MNWLETHFTEIVTIALAVKVTATTIVNITKTRKDDEVVTKLYRVIELFAGVWTKKVKE